MLCEKSIYEDPKWGIFIAIIARICGIPHDALTLDFCVEEEFHPKIMAELEREFAGCDVIDGNEIKPLTVEEYFEFIQKKNN